MRIFSLITVCCPGLSGLLRYGRWGHLIIALSFIFSFNTAILLNYHWVDCVPAGGKKWVLLLLVALWGILSVLADMQSKKYENIINYDTKGDLFLQITTFYLKGNWFETECMIRKLLQNNPGDVEALLMLATLYRHTERFNEADQILRNLGHYENAKKWHYEILLEKIALQNAFNGEQENSDADSPQSEDSSEDLNRTHNHELDWDLHQEQTCGDGESDPMDPLPDEFVEKKGDNSGKPRLRIVHPDDDSVSGEWKDSSEMIRSNSFDNQNQLLERNA